jgi:hypothetical protein
LPLLKEYFQRHDVISYYDIGTQTSYFRTIPLRSHINSFQIQFLPRPRHWQFRKIVRERLQDRRDHSYRHLIAYPARPSCPIDPSSNREKGVTYKDQDHHQHHT